jgi:hypothetical protein
MDNRNEIVKLRAEIEGLKLNNRLQSENNTGTPLQRFTQGRIEQLVHERIGQELRRTGDSLY